MYGSVWVKLQNARMNLSDAIYSFPGSIIFTQEAFLQKGLED